jgi:hypothetical protein
MRLTMPSTNYATIDVARGAQRHARMQVELKRLVDDTSLGNPWRYNLFPVFDLFLTSLASFVQSVVTVTTSGYRNDIHPSPFTGDVVWLAFQALSRTVKALFLILRGRHFHYSGHTVQTVSKEPSTARL